MSNLRCLSISQELLEIRKLASNCKAVRTYCSQDTAFELMKIEHELNSLVEKLDKDYKEAEERCVKKYFGKVEE